MSSVQDDQKTINGLKVALRYARSEKSMIAAFLHDGTHDQWIPNQYGIPLAVICHAFRKGCHMKEIRKDGMQCFELKASKSEWESYWIECAILYSELEKYDKESEELYRSEATSVIAMIKQGYIPLAIEGKPIDPDDLDTLWVAYPAIATKESKIHR